MIMMNILYIIYIYKQKYLDMRKETWYNIYHVNRMNMLENNLLILSEHIYELLELYLRNWNNQIYNYKK